MKALPKFRETDLIIEFISNKILENREYMFGEHDNVMKKLANYFYNVSFIKNVTVTSSNLLFLFDKVSIKNLFIKAADDELLKIKFSTLINLITHNCDDRSLLEEKLINIIR